MIRCFEYGRTDATEIADNLIYYKKIIMTRDTYEGLCLAEDVAIRLLENAHRAQGSLMENFVR